MTDASEHETARANALAAAVFARSLCAGDSDVVISPGSRSTPLALAFAALPEARCHVVLDERAAAFVALGLARARGRAAVLLCTSGSAAGHYLPAFMEASHARVPLIAVSADRPPELHHCGAPQTALQANLFGPFARLAVDLPSPHLGLDWRWLRNVGARARLVADGSPAGPVHLNAPFAEPLWQGTTSASLPPSGWTVAGVKQPSVSALSWLAARLGETPRGLIVCGPLAPATIDPEDLAHAVVELSAALGWPILADPASGLRFGAHDRAAVIGSYDLLLRSDGAASALAPDVVLRLGMPPTSKTLGKFLARHGRDRAILIDPDGQWLDPTGAACALVEGDATSTCRGLARALGAVQTDRRWIAAWRDTDAQVRAALEQPCHEGDWEGRLARTLCQALPDGAQLHLGSSMPIRDVDAFAPPSGRRLRVQASRGLNGIDGAVATAAGEALAWQGPTVALIGDLTLRHDIGGLFAAVALGARLTLVVIDNGGGGIFSCLPIASDLAGDPALFERLFTTPQPQPLGPACRAAGARHQRIDDLGSLGRVVAASLEQPGVGVVEVAVDRLASVAARRNACAAVAEILARTDRAPETHSDRGASPWQWTGRT